jgi:hypothetical protein
MDNNKRIKKYKSFINTMSSKRSKFNKIHIEGEIPGGFFSRSKTFEIVVYFTNIKKLLFDFEFKGVDKNDKKLDFNFKIGDHIDRVREWCLEKGYEITFERNK